MPVKTLADVVPREFRTEFTDSLATKYLACEVRETVDGRVKAWPGHHKNVLTWWILDNGYAVGWNENPAVGWSFPILRLK